MSITVNPNTSLSSLSQQLNLNNQGVQKELRAKGTDLYVKDGPKTFSKDSARTSHRNDAIALVKGAMEHEFHLTPGQSQRVLQSVFGGPLNQVTVGNVNRLQQLGTDALRFQVGNTNPEQSFGIAQKVETLMNTGVGHGPAVARGDLAALLVGPGVSVDTAWDLSRIVQQLMNSGDSQQEAIARALVVNELRGAEPNMSEQTAIRLSVDVRAKVANNMALAVAVNHAVSAFQKVESVMSGQAQVPGQIAVDERAMFKTCVRIQVEALPTFANSNPAQQTSWQRVGVCVGVMSSNIQRQFTLDERMSMYAATGGDTVTKFTNSGIDLTQAPLPMNTPGVVSAKDAYTAFAKLGPSFPIGDLTPPSELQKMQRFFDAVQLSPRLLQARDNWGTMDGTQRAQVLREVMRLHSHEFGYQVPTLTVTNQGNNGNIGSFLNLNQTLTLNNGHPNWNNFELTFNTVVHESTHCYQDHLVGEFRNGNVVAGDDRYEQAQILDINERAPVTENLLERFLGVAHGTAYSGYRNAPVETHAYHWGDTAQQMMHNWH